MFKGMFQRAEQIPKDIFIQSDKIRTIRQQECERPRGVLRSKFKVDVDRSTERRENK